MMNFARLALPLLALPLLAASPDRSLNLQVPVSTSPFAVSSLPLPPALQQHYQPAPLPNRNVELLAPRATPETHVAPTLFTRADQYRGDGFAKGSTSQSEEEKRYHPAAGLSLHMPLTGN